jgi:asparagine synthase (glutamine-hydrolysing)
MCGISGFSAKNNQDLIRKMSDLMTHRGPDDSGVWFSNENGIALAHNRLSIIDLSPSGKQPMIDHTGNVIITFNGEIYNYRELKDDLKQKGYVFHSSTDTEVILNLYREKGCSLLNDLNGIFAFALWDYHKKILFIARDGMGVKPLYYMTSKSGFYFASELKSLNQVPDIDRSLNTEAIHYYISYLWCPSPHTPFKSVVKLEPGCALIVENGNITQKWQFYEIPLGKDIKKYSKQDAIELCREHLSRAVKRQMVADVEVATFLSGGVDSSAITHYAQQYCEKKPVKSFTMNYSAEDMRLEGLVDDLPYARIAADKLGVDLKIIDVNTDLFQQLPFMLYHLDEPQADLAPLNVFNICKLAKESGVKVLLSGAGGDDLFTGYRRHQALFYKEKFRFVPPYLLKQLYKVTGQLPEDFSILRRLKKALFSSMFTGAELLESYFHWLRDDLQCLLYSNDFRSKLDSVKSDSPVLLSAKSLPSEISAIDKMLYLELKYYLTDHNLNYTDKLSMATGVEVRVPFLDPDLVAFAFTLPSSFKQRGNTGKWVLKKAMEQYLPQKIIYRPKTGFGIPLRKMIKDNHRVIMNDYLSRSSLEKRGLFDYEAVNSLVLANQNGRVEAGYTIFSLICMEIWMRIFVDGKKP